MTACRVLVVECSGKGRPRHRWQIKIQMDLVRTMECRRRSLRIVSRGELFITRLELWGSATKALIG